MTKRLLLTSQASTVLDILKDLLPISSKKFKVGFISTAGNPYLNKPWVEEDKRKLTELGLEVFDVDINNKDKEELRNILKDIDILFVAGGNTFYLLEKTRKSGFDEVAKELINKGVLYIGSSAGSCLTCPTIETSSWKKQDKNIVGLKDLTGMSFVPFLIFPHHKPEWKKIVEENSKKTSLPVLALTDQQAVLWIDGKCKIIGEGEKITFNGFRETLYSGSTPGVDARR